MSRGQNVSLADNRSSTAMLKFSGGFIYNFKFALFKIKLLLLKVLLICILFEPISVIQGCVPYVSNNRSSLIELLQSFNSGSN